MTMEMMGGCVFISLPRDDQQIPCSWWIRAAVLSLPIMKYDFKLVL